MHEAIIESWNKTVSPDDNVYHLGDVAFATGEKVRDILSRLNGTIYFVRGNHDSKRQCKLLMERSGFQVSNKMIIEDTIDSVEYRFHLCHYPQSAEEMIEVRSASRNAGQTRRDIFLHGDSHSDDINQEFLRIDVGVENQICRFGEPKPFSSREIIELLGLIKK